MSEAKKVINDQNVSDFVYCGRPSKWGNYLEPIEGETRNQFIDRWEQSVLSDPDKCKMIREELAGKHLVCFCAPKRCHTDIYLRIANPPEFSIESLFT